MRKKLQQVEAFDKLVSRDSCGTVTNSSSSSNGNSRLLVHCNAAASAAETRS